MFSKSINCVILNCCLSDSQARKIHEHIPIVLGMKKEIEDDIACQFSTSFYQAIGAGKEIKFAFEFAKNALQSRNLVEHLIPVIYCRE